MNTFTPVSRLYFENRNSINFDQSRRNSNYDLLPPYTSIKKYVKINNIPGAERALD